MTKTIMTALALAGAVMALSTAADAACTVNSSRSNASDKVWTDSVTGQSCTPTAAEQATTVHGSKSNCSEKGCTPNKPKGGTNPIGSATGGAGSGR